MSATYKVKEFTATSGNACRLKVWPILPDGKNQPIEGSWDRDPSETDVKEQDTWFQVHIAPVYIRRHAVEKLKLLPLRVDFAGGWLDVPRFAVQGAYIVNCAISPLVQLIENNQVDDPDQIIVVWSSNGNPPTYTQVAKGSGLGTSAVWHMLNGRDAIKEELAAGAGWQDPAIIEHGGLACWASGPEPSLVHNDDGAWLRGHMALHWTGVPHVTASLLDRPRDYLAIANASNYAERALSRESLGLLAAAVERSYHQQLTEGMDELPPIGMASKYCGAGHGGYAVYLFENEAMRDRAVAERGMMAVEPYSK